MSSSKPQENTWLVSSAGVWNPLRYYARHWAVQMNLACLSHHRQGRPCGHWGVMIRQPSVAADEVGISSQNKRRTLRTPSAPTAALHWAWAQPTCTSADTRARRSLINAASVLFENKVSCRVFVFSLQRGLKVIKKILHPWLHDSHWSTGKKMFTVAVL